MTTMTSEPQPAEAPADAPAPATSAAGRPASALSNDSLRVFNKRDRVIEGWYWALRAKDLKPGKAAAATVNGKDLVLFRTRSGEVRALDAYCPHRGSHLSLGEVEGDGIRCGYHRWKMSGESGDCVDVPCLDKAPDVGVQSWPVVEKYGLLWVYTGKEPAREVPFCPPELVGDDVAVGFGIPYQKGCHPNVVMCDAIDAQHFHSVHGFSGGMLDMVATVDDDISMRVENRGRMPKTGIVRRFLSSFYKDELTYALAYWYGTTGTVTVGPDFLHAYIMFTNRMGEGGCTEGQTVLLTRKRKGPLGWVVNRAVLFLTWLVGAYFAMGDTPQFNSIRFDFKTPIKPDHSLITFVQHVEQQKTAPWGYGDPARIAGQTPAAGPEPLRIIND